MPLIRKRVRPKNRAPKSMGHIYRLRNTNRRAGHLAGMPASRPALSRTRGRHRRAVGGAETGRGMRIACGRRRPTRPRPGRTGLRVVRPPPGRRRLGRDRRRPPGPGPAPQGPSFPAGRARQLTPAPRKRRFFRHAGTRSGHDVVRTASPQYWGRTDARVPIILAWRAAARGRAGGFAVSNNGNEGPRFPRNEGHRACGASACETVIESEPNAFERILAALHEAALDPDRWPRASALIDELLGTHGNTLGKRHPDPIRESGLTATIGVSA